MHVKTDATTDSSTTDRTALLLMLAYVEAECRRLGADAAARHAAMAAALVPDLGLGKTCQGPALH